MLFDISFFYQGIVKRIFDIILATTIIILTSPIVLIISILLFFFNDADILFIQERLGLNEKKFKLLKFKTMKEKYDKNGILLSDSDRLTKIGLLIRKYSLDELPQLFNVIKGDMSMIGPRPLLTEYLPLYNDEQKRRHLVKPGISGWAQVNGRNTLSWSDRFKYDIYYVDNISFLLDLKIFFLTIHKIVKSEGISSLTSATMEKFTGNI